MTNLIGSIVVLLSVTSTSVTVTNQVGLTCRQAGCTNQVDVNTLAVEKLGNKCAWHKHYGPYAIWPYNFPCGCEPDTLTTNVVKGCVYWHTSNMVQRIGTRTDMVFGDAGRWLLTLPTRKMECSNAVPMYTVHDLSITNTGWHGNVWYDSRTWVTVP